MRFSVTFDLLRALILLSLTATVPPISSSRYFRKSDVNGTSSLISLYPKDRDSITEFLLTCTSRASLPCPLNAIMNDTLRNIHANHLAVAKGRILWTQDHYLGPFSFGLPLVIFLICFCCGIFLVLNGHLDCRQFGQGVVTDGSFGFSLSIIKSMGFHVVHISHSHYERIIDQRLAAAMRTTTEEGVDEDIQSVEGSHPPSIISVDARKRVNILTREEVHQQENERRQLRAAQRNRIENEEALMNLQLKKFEDAILAQKEDYYMALLEKYKLPD